MYERPMSPSPRQQHDFDKERTMRFSHNNAELDTAWMTSFTTDQPCLPFVHIHADGTCFLETRRDRWEESHIRPIPRFEALRIAALYNLPDLKQFLISQKQKSRRQRH